MAGPTTYSFTHLEWVSSFVAFAAKQSYKALWSVRRLSGAAATLALVSCGGGGSSVEVPPLQITTSTTGFDLDPDGYAASIDGGTAIAVGVNDTVVVGDAATGRHVVTLSGVASNCQMHGGESDTVAVTEGSTVSADFAIVCATVAVGDGAIEVAAATAGTSFDPDGYEIVLDGRHSGSVAVNATATVGGISPGEHTVGLGGVAANCQVAEENPQSVLVAADSTSALAFAVSCSDPSGGAIARWTALPQPNSALVYDVWGSGPSDFWAVGTDLDDANAGVIEHYDGIRWSEQLRLPEIQLDAVWGTGPQDVYAVGGRNGSAAGAILHYDGSSWSEVSGPAVTSPGDTLVLWQSITGLSGQDIYVVGAGYSPTLTPLAAHFDGQGWTTLTLPAVTHRELLDVWASSPEDVYVCGVLRDPATGEDNSHHQGLVLHYDGENWTESTHGELGVHLKAVWGTGPNNVYVVGDPGIVVHWDGVSWNEEPRLITTALHEIWGTSPANIYAVAARGAILRFDGTQWTRMENPSTRDLFGLWGSAPDDAWSAGVRGIILHGTP
jgi:hypothetical protein